MGQKVHPKIFRIGTTQDWKSKWFAKGADVARNLEQDVKIRKYIQRKLRTAGISQVEIERSGVTVNISIHTSKPGIVIGRGGQGVEDLRKEILKNLLPKGKNVNLSIQEVAKPSLDAELVSQNIIEQLEKRIPFRRVAKQSVEQVMRAGAKGVKIIVKGRLDGGEIARKETFNSGSVPLHTLRADIHYARGAAFTSYGNVGVKVWIYKGEVFQKDAVAKQGS